jgi:DNA-binding transcriptional LysR family regulator
MAMPRLSELSIFVEVAERRSFTRAAAALGLSPSATSHAMRELEARLGVRLLHRTTRSVTPTEAGAELLHRLKPALSGVEEALAGMDAWQGRPRGTLRINMPRAARRLVAPVVARYLAENPEMRLEIECEDKVVDIVAEGFDAGVRFDERLPPDMIAVPIPGALRFAVVAAPAYLDRHGTPTTPADLARHRCIRRRFSGANFYRWELERGDEAFQVNVEGPFATNDDVLALEAAADGAGLALTFEDMAMPWLASGRLVRVLEDWCPPFPAPRLYYPSRRHMTAGLRAFIRLLRELEPSASIG